MDWAWSRASPRRRPHSGRGSPLYTTKDPPKIPSMCSTAERPHRSHRPCPWIPRPTQTVSATPALRAPGPAAPPPPIPITASTPSPSGSARSSTPTTRSIPCCTPRPWTPGPSSDHARSRPRKLESNARRPPANTSRLNSSAVKPSARASTRFPRPIRIAAPNRRPRHRPRRRPRRSSAPSRSPSVALATGA